MKSFSKESIAVNNRIIVAHPGKQHSFRMATALNKKGCLLSYITTVYDKSSMLMRIVKKVIGKNNAIRASTRKCKDIENDKVIQFCEWRSLITLFLVRVDKSKRVYWKWNQYVSNVFGKKVAKYAIKNRADMVVMYDSNASSCFEYLSKHAPNIIRVMDASHSNRLYEKDLFERDMEILPEWADNIRQENSYLWETSLEWVNKENELTQYFIVPSKYVKRTLLFSGVRSENIFIVPYGVDTNKFFPSELERQCEEVYFLYVGNATEMKGFGHLLHALRIVNEKYPGTNLHFVGGILDPKINSKYGNHVISHGYLQFSEMAEMYRKADVMVFPSLSEGMTLSGIEALCSGIPIICSENSGVNDLVSDGENGFVIHISNADAIADKMIWFIENKNEIPTMKKNALETGKKYTWNRYYENVGNVIDNLCQGNQNGND